MNDFLQAFGKLPTAFSTIAVFLSVLVAGKLFYLFANPRRRGPEGILTRLFSSNTALAIGISGYIVAIGLSLNCGVKLAGAGQWSASAIAIGGILSILLLQISMFINDKILIYKFDNTGEIVNNNIAVAIVESAGLIAVGFLLRGVLMSNSISFYDKFIDVAAYWLIGQAFLSVGGLAYQYFGHSDVNERIKNGDTGSAVAFGGFLIAYAMIIEASITGATSNIIGELPTILAYSSAGLITCLIVSKIVNFFFLAPSGNAASVFGTGLIGASVLASICFIFSGVIDSSITNNSEFESASTPDVVVPIEAKMIVPTTTEQPTTKPTTSSSTTSK